MERRNPTRTNHTDDTHARRGLRTAEAAVYLGVATATLRKWRMGRSPVRGPRFIKASPRMVIYPLEALDRWLSENTIEKSGGEHGDAAPAA